MFNKYSVEKDLLLVYSIIYSYWYFYSKLFLPHAIHNYTYRLIHSGALSDLWRDWVWTGMGPYSSRLGYQIVLLKNNGLVRETCVDKICGLLTITSDSIKPEKYYFTELSIYTM